MFVAIYALRVSHFCGIASVNLASVNIVSCVAFVHMALGGRFPCARLQEKKDMPYDTCLCRFHSRDSALACTKLKVLGDDNVTIQLQYQ